MTAYRYRTSGNDRHWQTPAYRNVSSQRAQLERTPDPIDWFDVCLWVPMSILTVAVIAYSCGAFQ